jgi:hypothetical protein
MMDESCRLALIAEAVRYCQRVSSLGMPSNCYTKALREPIFFLWETRNGGKAKVAKYRSKAAVGLKYGKAQLIYDHAVPFKFLQQKLLALQSVTEESIRSILEQHGIAVLITQAENALLNKHGYGSNMPPEWDGSDPLARYRAVGIELLPNSPL